MNNGSPIIAAMAEKCRGLIEESHTVKGELPEPLQPQHIGWMCDRIEEHADDWPETKLHRWIGFVQCAMIANGILDLRGAKAMFDSAKAAHNQTATDVDLTDHLDPSNDFEMELGGQG